MKKLVGIVAVVGAVALVGGLLVRATEERPARRVAADIAPFEEPDSPRLRSSAPGRPAPQGNARPGRANVDDIAVDPPAPAVAVPRRLVVRYRDDASAAEIAALHRGARVTPIRRLPLEDTEVVNVRKGTSVRDAHMELAASPAVAYAEPDFIYRAMATVPDDPNFRDLWGLSSSTGIDIRATEAWTRVTGDSSIRVGVVDTGVAYDHPDLAPNIAVNPGEDGSGKQSNGIDDDGNGYVDDWRGWDWVDDDNDPRDLEGHGTHVAGTIGAAGNNTLGVSGVNWRVGLVPLRVLDEGGSGSTSDIAAGFVYAGRAGIDIVNASFGGQNASQTILNAIASNPSTLYIVAAGNESSNTETTPSYPCSYTLENLICVTASTRTDTLALFANYGATSVDLAAPGSGILSTTPQFETIFEDEFEGGLLTNWITDSWKASTDNAGGYASATGGAPYAPSVNSSLTLLTPLLPASANCRVSYALRLDTEEDDDNLRIETSSDGLAWRTVSTESGNSEGWIEATAPLGDLSGGSLLLRARLTGDGDSVVGTGADIDALEVECLETFDAAGDYGYASGTSMASPHVAGTAALLRSAAPGISVAALKSALLAGTTPAPALAGKTATGGRLNAQASLALVQGDTAPPGAPSPSLTPRPTASPSGALPSLTPTTLPTPVPGSTPTPPTSTPDVDPGTPTGATRSIQLVPRRHLVLTGHVASGAEACMERVRVRILRNGSRIGRITTDATGSFRLRLKDRPGRYVAIAPAIPDQGCGLITSELARHSHVASASPVPVANCWSFRLEERQLLDETNATRAAFGRSMLREDRELSQAARVHTAKMVEEGSLSHTSSEEFRQRITGWTSIGENVGVGSTPSTLHSAFMNSPAHRHNILDDFTHIGVGAVTANGRLWVTVIFEAEQDPGTTLDMPDC